MDDVNRGEVIETVTVGHDFEGDYCCEWFNTCGLLYVGYDAEVGSHTVRDLQGNVFHYDKDYVLAYSLYNEPDTGSSNSL
jgi:hypothetical protein